MSAPFIVCAWHTPDYRPWADKLTASLDAIGAPYDIVEVPKLPGTWEANTMAKPGQLLAAMDRHPSEVIVFLDVDCEVLGDLSPLAGITGDVAFYIRTKYRRSGGMRFGARSGTVVVRPTPAARRYVEAWADAGRDAPWGDVDQTTQMIAMGRVPWCPSRCCRGVLRHGRRQRAGASRPARLRIPRRPQDRAWQRRLRRIWRALVEAA